MTIQFRGKTQASPQQDGVARPKVLVTGAAGYLGSVLVPMLLLEGYHVVAHDLYLHGQACLTDEAERLGLRDQLTLSQGDIRVLDVELLDDAGIVIHLAGLSNDASCDFDDAWSWAINHEATVRLGQMCRDKGNVQLVFSSSCSVYGASDTAILDETSEVAPLSLYARSKAQSEIELRAMVGEEFGVVCLRMGTLHGPSPQMRFDLVANQMTLSATLENQVKVGGGGEQWRPMLHVSDAARVFVEAASRADLGRAGAVLNVVAENSQIGDLGDQIGQALGAKVVKLDECVDPRNYRVSGAALEHAMSYVPQTTVRQSAMEVQRRLSSDEYGAPYLDRYYPLRTAHLIHEGELQRGGSHA